MSINLFKFSSCTSEVVNGSVHTGSLWRTSQETEDHGHINGEGVLSDQAIIIKSEEKSLVEDEIEFHDGWAPSHYE